MVGYRTCTLRAVCLDSTNGTFLNEGTDPMAREEIKDNDVVRLEN